MTYHMVYRHNNNFTKFAASAQFALS